MTRTPVKPELLARARERAAQNMLARAGHLPKLSEWEGVCSIDKVADEIATGGDELTRLRRERARFVL